MIVYNMLKGWLEGFWQMAINSNTKKKDVTTVLSM